MQKSLVFGKIEGGKGEPSPWRHFSLNYNWGSRRQLQYFIHIYLNDKSPMLQKMWSKRGNKLTHKDYRVSPISVATYARTREYRRLVDQWWKLGTNIHGRKGRNLSLIFYERSHLKLIEELNVSKSVLRPGMKTIFIWGQGRVGNW